MAEVDPQEENDVVPRGKKEKSIVGRIVKCVVITLCCIVLLAAIAIGAIWYLLTPESLTPMFSKYSSEYLDADVTAEKVELSFWETFPRVTLEIEGLKVRSRSLDGLSDEERSELPSNADSLLSVKRFKGGVNVWAMTMGKVRLYDVELEEPNLFIVKVNDSINNYNIIPPMEETDTTFSMPPITIDNFVILGEAPIRYYSKADSTDVMLTLKASTLSGSHAPAYAFDLAGTIGGKLAPKIDIPKIPIGLDGTLKWNQQEPMKIGLENFTISASDVALNINANLEFDSTAVCKDVVIKGKNINIADAINLIPENMRGELAGLKTDISLDMNIEVLEDYVAGSDRIPSMRITMNIPGGSVVYDRLTIRDLQAYVNAFYNGSNPNLSTIDIKKFNVTGNMAQFSLEGNITSPLQNPKLDGHFKGMVDLDAMPSQLAKKLPFLISGDLKGETDFKFRIDDLTREGFHKVNANGTLSLKDFRFEMRDSTSRMFTKYAQFDFGTLSTYEKGGQKVDSLLRVTLTADSVAFMGEGVRLISNGFRMSAGTKNTADSYDTTRINPLGIVVSAEKLRLHSLSDSINLNLTQAEVKGLLQRYKKQDKRPLLKLDISTGRLRYTDPVSRVSLRDAQLGLQVHPKARRSLRSERQLQKADSVSSARRSGSKSSRERASSGHKNLDFNLDRSLMSWLRHWEASGTVKAMRGRLMTPYFPVRNTLRNVDVIFSTDSVVVNNLDYQMGKSDFNIKGKVTNIVRALTSASGSPLRLDFDINCDTLDANNITSAILAGSAYAEKVAQGTVSAVDMSSIKDDDADDDKLEKKIDEQMNDSARAPFIVPWNIDAKLNINANSLLYADIWFQKMSGRIAVSDGAIHIDRLAGYTPIGSMDISALYSAPTKNDLKFAAGMVVRDLHLKQFIHLLPEIESILPLLKEVNGIITADVAMTTDLDSLMNMKFHTFHLVLKLQGKNLTLVDTKDFIKAAKLLRLEKDGKITINDMQVELMVKDSHLDLFPFVFNFDRYKFGVSGGNDFDGDLDYHIAVLKSPIPFKFGVTIKGKPGHLRFRLGKANFNEDKVASSRLETDTLRINLVEKIKSVFKFGVKNGHYVKLMEEVPKVSPEEFLVADTLTHADSLIFMQAGVFEGHDVPPFPEMDNKKTPAEIKAEKKIEKEREKEAKRLRKEEEKALKRKEREEKKALK
ncbi:MAG: hypothetical protein J1E38_09975 [Paramuribaculum sp.]|nr:hypothetical protein [Paramuribaculum sp.]